MAAVGLAGYFVLSARSGGALPPLVSAWAGCGRALLLGAAALVRVVPWRTSESDVEFAGRSISWLVPVLGLALLAAAFAYATGIAAVRRLGSRLSSFVGLGEVLFAVVARGPRRWDGSAGTVQLVGGSSCWPGSCWSGWASGRPRGVDQEPVPGLRRRAGHRSAIDDAE